MYIYKQTNKQQKPKTIRRLITNLYTKMEALMNSSILVSETCVSDCLKDNKETHHMNICIQQCLVREKICKSLKMCMRNKCGKKIINHLMKACLESGLEVVKECRKHSMKCCQNCVKVVGNCNQQLKTRLSKSSKKTFKKNTF